MTDTLLLTGATGFIGSHLLETLLENNYRMVILKRSFSDDWRISQLYEKYTENLIPFDVDKTSLEHVFKKEEISGIIHLATYYKKIHEYEDIAPLIESNIEFPVQLLDLAVSNKVKFFINTGTFFEYDSSYLPISELTHIKPLNLYAATKISFEKILKTYSELYNIKSATLKIFSPYGPRDNEKKIIPHLILNSLKNNKISLSNGLQKLDFVFVKDIVDSYLKLISKIEYLDKYENFNIASGNSHSIRELVSILEEINGQNMNKIWGDPSEDSEIILSDISKARNILKWVPQISIKEGLSKTVQYYRDKYDL